MYYFCWSWNGRRIRVFNDEVGEMGNKAIKYIFCILLKKGTFSTVCLMCSTIPRTLIFVQAKLFTWHYRWIVFDWVWLPNPIEHSLVDWVRSSSIGSELALAQSLVRLLNSIKLNPIKGMFSVILRATLIFIRSHRGNLIPRIFIWPG